MILLAEARWIELWTPEAKDPFLLTSIKHSNSQFYQQFRKISRYVEVYKNIPKYAYDGHNLVTILLALLDLNIWGQIKHID